MKRPKCLRPGCDKEAESRGLCRPDYNAAKQAVKKGFASWDKLQEMGKVLPKQRGHNPASWGWLLDWSDDPGVRSWTNGAQEAKPRKKKMGWPKGKKRGPGRPRKVPLVMAEPQAPTAVYPFERTQ